jgi:hypothetical protein
MSTRAHLDPAEFEHVSPAIVDALVTMLDGHAWLASFPSVHVAVLAVAAKYRSRLRDPPPGSRHLTEADQRRALIFLRNTDPRVPGFPDLRIVELFDEALRVIATSGRRSSASAANAFEQAICTLIDVVRHAPGPRREHLA